MALLYCDSFDHYQTAQFTEKWTTEFTGYAIRTGEGRCGSHALKGTALMRASKGIPFGSMTAIVGYAIKLNPDASLDYINFPLFALGASSQNHVTLIRQVDGSIAVRLGDSFGTLLGQTAPDVLQMGHWYFLELQATIAAAPTGAVTLRLDGVPVLTLSGITTVGPSAAAELRRIVLLNDNNVQYWVDDLYVCDSTGSAPANTFLGDVRVEYLRPRDVGTHQDFPTVVGPSHWEAVDDDATPDDDGTYVESATVGHTDTNLYMATGLPAGAIFGAQVNLYVKKSEIGPRLIAPIVRSGGTTVAGPSVAPTADSYTYLVTTFPTNPVTGSAWTIAQINAAEFGVRVVS